MIFTSILKKVSLFVALCMCVSVAYSQSVDELMKKARQEVKQDKEKKGKQKPVKELTDEEKAEQLFMKNIDSLQVNKNILEDSINSRKKEIRKLDKSYNDSLKAYRKLQESKEYAEYKALRRQVDSLNSMVASKESGKTALEEKINRTKKKISDVEGELKSYNEIVEGHSSDIISGNKGVLEKSLADLKEKELEDIREKCKNYVTVSSGIKDFNTKVGNLILAKRFYDRTVSILNSPYSKQDVYNALEEIGKHIALCYTKDQKQILREQGKKLQAYPKGVSTFGDFITVFNEKRVKEGEGYNKETSKMSAEDVLLSYSEDINGSINVVPRLKALFNYYIKMLTEDCWSEKSSVDPKTVYSGTAVDVLKQLEVVKK